MMYPTLRGSAGNPGYQENFYGEVNDVLSALEYLRKQDFVDPDNIYLGGHSTGATLALLVACTPNKFKSIFAFGPVGDPAGYGEECQYHDTSIKKEQYLRAPINFIDSVTTPTYVIEGTEGNYSSLQELKKSSSNNSLHFVAIPHMDHFEALAPGNKLIAAKLLQAKTPFTLNAKEISTTALAMYKTERETNELDRLTYIRGKGVDFTKTQKGLYYYVARKKEALKAASAALHKLKFTTRNVETYKDSQGKPYHLLIAEKNVNLMDLKYIFDLSAKLKGFEKRYDISYDDWAIK